MTETPNTEKSNTKKKKDRYRETLHLPRTTFNMRGNLRVMEPEMQERWKGMDLYEQTRRRQHPRGPFRFHDGPPYANGSIHLGHLLNKILKDMVVRSRIMDGYDVHFVPGWDCHGLPIEHKVMKELGAEARELETLERRKRCSDYARHYMDLQSTQLQQLGTLADYAEPYFTMDPAYEACTLDVFATMVGEGIVYRDLKPVHWSIENRTALADAELEYYDRDDVSVHVLFEIEDPSTLPASLGAPAGEPVQLMIWTTTPWTLPANLAVAVAAGATYGLYRFRHGDVTKYAVVAENLREAVFAGHGGEVESLGSCPGQILADGGVKYRHPFIDRVSPVVLADYVTLEDGTGLVHTAPGHGADDYHTGIREGLPIYCPVLGDGTFDETAPEWLQTKDVWAANPLVTERLRGSGHLFRDEPFTHSYPHDWRGKTPTIFRATEQWFISVEKPYGDQARSLLERALEATESQITFVPEWGRNRLRGMLEARPDWCISRQRSWGLPIPAFTTTDGGMLLTRASVTAIAEHVRRHGSDAWFAESPQQLLEGYDPAADDDAPEAIRTAGRDGLSSLVKGNDIFDVWFESGSSWNVMKRLRDIGYPCDLYLEGSDQHRGWFQLSLLAGLGATAQTPFTTVLTHGFMVTGKGQKMSKSLGNTIEVEDLLKKHGADVCRWWTATLNYVNDIKVDWEFFKVAGDEYRKVRNTIRFMLGNLKGFDPARHGHTFSEADRGTIDGWARDRLAQLIHTVRRGYETYQFKRVTEAIFNFCNDAMSAVYLAAVKDRLYCDAEDEPRRRRTQTVLFETADALIRLTAPILVHTADEAWAVFSELGTGDQKADSAGPAESGGTVGDGLDTTAAAEFSIHLEDLPKELDWALDSLESFWEEVMGLREMVLRRIEQVKEETGLTNPLDAGVVVEISGEMKTAWDDAFGTEVDDFMADLCGVSRFRSETGNQLAVREIEDLREEPRCERSWKRDGTVRRRSDGGMLTDRDARVVGVE